MHPVVRLLLLFSLAWRAAILQAADPAGELRPLLERYCLKCHDGDVQKGDVDLERFGSAAAMQKEFKLWQKVLQQIAEDEMPPKDPLPGPAERSQLIAGVRGVLDGIDWNSMRRAGYVPLARLTREEYNNTLRDLLGVDLRAGDLLPQDGEGQSGFNNDRGSLFITPELAERYFDAASRALDALIALGRPPVEWKLESENMLMTEKGSKPVDLPTGLQGYHLNRGQMTLFDSITVPHDGFYEFTIRAQAMGGPSGARLRLDDEPKGDLFTESGTQEELTLTAFVPAGSHQMAWNIQLPPGLERPKSTRPPQGKKARAAYKPLPPEEEAKRIIAEKSEANTPKFPETGDESREISRAINDYNRSAQGLQRSIEWMRLAGPEGDPADVARFQRLYAERFPQLQDARKVLSGALGISGSELDRRLMAANAAKLESNAQALKIAGDILGFDIAVGPPRTPGGIAIDWVRIRGPMAPDGGAAKNRVFGAQPGNGTDAAGAARRIINAFAERAFRRPVKDSELTRYEKLFQRAYGRGDGFEASVKLALTGALVSPRFLFRDEVARDPGEQEQALDDWQIASRLSYFLWLSMPDDELFALARQGGLRDPETLRAQVRRMLKDPKAEAFAQAFPGQWLGYASLGTSVLPDAKKFPQFTPELADAMKDEVALGFLDLLRENLPLSTLIDSRNTHLNAALARHYGVDGVTGSAMQKVSLDDPNRGGILGMGAILTATSSPQRTNPVTRGKWVLETMLGTKLPEPPANAGILDADAGEKGPKTLRQELEEHRSRAECAGCHSKVDPIGFGLENFDAIGRFRVSSNGKPIDSVGELPDGTRFRGPAELKSYLLNHRSQEFQRNLVERLLAFALGRPLQPFDEPVVRDLTTAVSAADGGGGTLIEEIVLSRPFLNRGAGPSE